MYLCCGDALFDLFAAPSEDPAAVTLDGRAGGSPMNVAIGLARLRARSGYFTKISRDVFGERIMAHLGRENVGTELIVRSDALSTLAVVALDRNGVASYSFYIEGTADRSLEIAELPARLPDELKVVHIASYSTAIEPTGSTLAALVAREKPARIISYDPNIRDTIEPDLDVWRERVAALSTSAHVMKVSEEDMEKLYPGTRSDELAAQWIGSGVELAIITHGADGASGFSAGGASARVPGVKVTVVDTVGAGDSFQAASLNWLGLKSRLSPAALASLDRTELEAMLGYAARAAAITCSRRGADMPRAEEMEP